MGLSFVEENLWQKTIASNVFVYKMLLVFRSIFFHGYLDELNNKTLFSFVADSSDEETTRKSTNKRRTKVI